MPTPEVEELIGRIAVEWQLIDAGRLAGYRAEIALRAANGDALRLEQILLREGRAEGAEIAELQREARWRVTRPEILDRFRIEGTIGRGGMGRVYRVVDRKTGRPAALKILRGVAFSGAGQRFEREAIVLARIDHPNVVRLLEWGRAGERIFILLELLEGETLEGLLGDRAIDLREGVRVVEQAARGVQAAHEAGIVHRDIKPANILRAVDGRVVVLDFGVAHLVESSAALTNDGDLLGTVGYMAPEQISGEPGDIGPRTDVHALGLILYEVLTGRPAFAEEEDALSSVLVRSPTAPSTLSPGIPPRLEAVALRAIAKRPGERYASAAALADELAPFAGR